MIFHKNEVITFNGRKYTVKQVESGFDKNGIDEIILTLVERKEDMQKSKEELIQFLKNTIPDNALIEVIPTEYEKTIANLSGDMETLYGYNKIKIKIKECKED